MTIKKFNFEKKYKDSKKEKGEIKVIGHGEPGQKGCPRCKSLNLFPHTTLYKKNRAYRCLDCKSDLVSPTTWASCTNEWVIRKTGGRIGKDLVVNDCLICPIPKKEAFNILKLVKEGKACPYFNPTPIKFDEEEQFN